MTSVQQITSEEDARGYVAALCDVASMQKLEDFTSQIISENRSQNLISKSSEESIWQRHIADSAQLLRFVPRETEDKSARTWLDLGTGAGMPGLVVAVLRPSIAVKLVESRTKRIEFLQNCVEALDLENCEVIGNRLERVTPFATQVISARAFAPLTKLLRLSAPFSTDETTYILPKGRSASAELREQTPELRRTFHVEQSLTDRDAGIIVGTRAPQ